MQAAGELGARYVLVPTGSPAYDFQKLSDFAQSRYGMQVIPVRDTDDVVTYFLGEEEYCSCRFEISALYPEHNDNRVENILNSRASLLSSCLVTSLSFHPAEILSDGIFSLVAIRNISKRS